MKSSEEFYNRIKKGNKIVFLTGAGVSVDSGIKDFETIYSKKFMGYAGEEILSHDFFYKNPKVFFEFIKENLSQEKIEPNVVHKFISYLEMIGKKVVVLTQNVDGLHQKAGSTKVVELHGNLKEFTCTDCGEKKGLNTILYKGKLDCENCETGLYKPNCILYGEDIDTKVFRKAIIEIATADTLVVMGTRLLVQADYILLNYFKGNNFIVANKNYVEYQDRAQFAVNKPFIEFMPDVFNLLMEDIQEQPIDYGF